MIRVLIFITCYFIIGNISCEINNSGVKLLLYISGDFLVSALKTSPLMPSTRPKYNVQAD